MEETLQERQVNAAFSKQSPVFDRIDEENKLIVWMRQRIHKEVLSFIRKGDHMLELNCGTGIDALYFASQDIRVKATDFAPGMLEQLNRKIIAGNLQHLVTTQRCSFNNLEELGSEQQYDYVFSDFGGLNCTDRLDKVLDNIDGLLKPGGKLSLVIMPRICLWEMMMVFKGYFRTAFRRFRKGGTVAQVEGLPFKCYYYSPDYIINHLGAKYRLLGLKGLAVTVPPPYIEHFIEKHPKLFRRLEKWENKIWNKAPFNRWGDHYIITMEKTG